MIGVTECSFFYSSFHNSKKDILKKYEQKRIYMIKVNRNSLFVLHVVLAWVGF